MLISTASETSTGVAGYVPGSVTFVNVNTGPQSTSMAAILLAKRWTACPKCAKQVPRTSTRPRVTVAVSRWVFQLSTLVELLDVSSSGRPRREKDPEHVSNTISRVSANLAVAHIYHSAMEKGNVRCPINLFLLSSIASLYRIYSQHWFSEAEQRNSITGALIAQVKQGRQCLEHITTTARRTGKKKKNRKAHESFCRELNRKRKISMKRMQLLDSPTSCQWGEVSM